MYYLVLEIGGRQYLLHDRQDPGLRIVVAVSADAQVDLLIGGVFAIGLHQTEKRVLGGSGHGGRGEDGRAGGTHDLM